MCFAHKASRVVIIFDNQKADLIARVATHPQVNPYRTIAKAADVTHRLPFVSLDTLWNRKFFKPFGAINKTTHNRQFKFRGDSCQVGSDC